jgi:4-amino-4-deoxy-L-arabinose transferase-like glycosyltransferase
VIRRAVQPLINLLARPWARLAAACSGLGYGRTVGVVTALGAAIRIAGLARQPLGYDEDFTALVVHQPLGRMFDIVSRDSAPPLFYALERLIVAAADVFGLAGWGGPGGPVVLRVVPALAGIAAIPLIAALARRVGGNSAGLWAALFAALVPTAVMLSGFVRMYGLGATLTVASALLLWRAVDKSTTVRWLTYFAAAATAAWTDYFCVIALAGIVAAALWLRRGRRVSALAIATTTAAVATLAPWLLVAQAQFQHAGQGFWVPPLSFSMIGGTYCQLFMGPPIDWAIPFGLPLVGLQFAAVLAGSAALAYAAVAWRQLPADGRRGAIYLLIASGGVAILAIVSIWRPVLDARYAGVMWLPLFALAGVGLAAMPRRYATLLLLAVTVPTLALSTVTTHRQTSELVPELDARVGTHDLAAAAWDHYLILLDETSPAVQSRLHVLSTTGLPWYVGTAAYPEGAAIDTIPADVIAGHGRIFWIADPGVPAPVLPAGYRQNEVSCAIEVCLTIYEPPAG